MTWVFSLALSTILLSLFNATVWCLEKSGELSNNSPSKFKLVHFPTQLIFVMETHITISKQFFLFNILFKM